MPPAAKRPTATKRTAAARPQTFDERRQAAIAARQETAVFEWEGYGRTWHLRRPNPALVAGLEETESVTAIINFILGYIVEDERDEFYAALAGDEALDFDILGLITTEFSEIVYAEIPTVPSSAS